MDLIRDHAKADLVSMLVARHLIRIHDDHLAAHLHVNDGIAAEKFEDIHFSFEDRRASFEAGSDT